MNWQQYDLATVVPTVYFRKTTRAFFDGGPTDYFALRLAGRVNVPEEGTWRFSLGSEDGARLLIDGQLVVLDEAAHSYRWANGAIWLSEGEHDIEVHFLESSWIAGLALTWQGPNDDYESVIPASASPSTIRAKPPPDVATIDLTPAYPAPTAILIAAISSSTCTATTS